MSEAIQSPPIPSPRSELKQDLEIAKECIQAGKLTMAYQKLDLALDAILSKPNPDLSPFLDVLPRFQEMLAGSGDYAAVKDQLCPNEQGLLGRLARAAKRDVALAQEAIATLRNGYTQLTEAPLSLQLAFLERAYHLAKHHELRPEQIRLLPTIGDLYLKLGETLPVEQCYEQGFKQACLCFAIAIDLSPEDLSLQDKPSKVEAGYLRRMLPSFDHLPEWSEKHIWKGKTTSRLKQAQSLAELMVEYNELKTSSSIYFHCVKYAQKNTCPEEREIKARHTELCQAREPIVGIRGWQSNRTRLNSIRMLTSFLFDHFFGDGNRKAPDFPEGLPFLVEAGLLPVDATNLDALADTCSIHRLQKLHGQMMIDLTKQLYERAIALFGRPPCDYTLVGLGSLARGEMGIFSDLDAIVLVKERNRKVVDYFRRVANYVELTIINLGETKCNFARFDHMRDRFCLDPAVLHPGRLIETPEGLLGYQQEELLSLVEGHDLDPIRNALRLTCVITGNIQLHQDYIALLTNYFVERAQAYDSELILDVKEVFDQAEALFKGPPCEYALIGLGRIVLSGKGIDFSRRAIIVVDRKTDENVSYFEHFPQYLNVAIANLKKTNEGCRVGERLKNLFRADPVLLQPDPRVNSSDSSLYCQLQDLESFKEGRDSGDLHLYSFVAGNKTLYDGYINRRKGKFAQNGEVYGNCLIKKRLPLSAKKPCFDAKKNLYRPITLLIDALSVKHNIDAVKTTVRLKFLQNFYPKSFIQHCEQVLELACRLRLQAQIHYGEESETIYLEPGDEPNPLLLSFSDRALLQAAATLIFEPISRMDLTAGLDVDVLERVRIEYLEKLIRQGQVETAAKIAWDLSTLPPGLAAQIAFGVGRFELAKDFYQTSRAEDLDRIDDLLDPYQRAYRAHAEMPSMPALASLAAALYGVRHGNSRLPIPPPSPSLFEGDKVQRRSALLHYLAHLPLVGVMRQRASDLACAYSMSRLPLPNDVQSLISDLLLIDQPTLDELPYGDLLVGLCGILEQTQEKPVVSYLFHLFPSQLRGRFLRELHHAKVPPDLIELLAHFPLSDGTRPHSLSPQLPLLLASLSGAAKGSIEGTQSSHFQLSKEASTFFAGLLKGKRGPYGRHSVDKMHGMYFKLDPEFPGREFAYLSLMKLVTGEAFPPRELIKISLGSQVHAVSTSLEVSGPSLQEVLEGSPASMKYLDFRHYCWAVLMTLLALPEDAKPDNFVVYQPSPGAPMRLIDIDPERVFFDAMKKKRLKKDEMQCKSILFCLDHMKKPLDPDVRKEFLALHPAALFEHWLEGIDRYNKRSHELFGATFIDRGLKASSPTEIPFFIEPTLRHAQSDLIRHRGLLLRLYERFRALQDALKRESDMPLIDLLIRIEPQLGARYQAELCKEKRVIDRFCDLTKTEYKRAKGSTLSITTTTLRGSYSKLEDFQKYGWTVESARVDLKKILVAHSSIQSLVDDLIDGEGLMLRALDLPEVSDGVLKAVDFTRMERGIQAVILDRISGLKFHQLHLGGCKALTDSRLKTILSSCLDLTVLDLHHSDGIVDLTYLKGHEAKLRKLNLRGLSSLTRLYRRDWRGRAQSQDFPQLEVLDIGDCRSLATLNLKAMKLKHLRCRGRPPSAAFELDCPNLESLAVDSQIALVRLARYVPSRLLYGPAEVKPIKDFDPLSLKKIEAIRQQDGFVLYQLGAADLSIMVKGGINAGYERFAVRHKDDKGRSSCFVRPLDRESYLAQVLELVRHFPDLLSVDLRGCKEFADTDLAQLAELCPGLRFIDLDDCTNLTDKGLQSLAKGCSKLASLGLSGCVNISDSGLEALTEGCPNLGSLDLSGCVEITDKGVQRLNWSALTSLNLNGCTEIMDPFGPWLEVGGGLTPPTSGMTSLDLGGCHPTDKWLTAIGGNFPKLRSLSLSRGVGITDMGVKQLADSCPHLESINLSGCVQLTDEGLKALAERSHSLTLLDVSLCKRLTDVGLEALVEGCPGLTSLNMQECNRLTDKGWRALARRCPGLSTLNFDECRTFTDSGVTFLVKRCPDLISLDLGSCQELRNSGLEAIAKSCPGLTLLHLGGSSHFTDDGFKVLAKYCPGLSSFDVGDCEQVTEKGWQALSEGCTGLTSLRLPCSDWLTDEALTALVERCTSLTSIDVSCCKLLTDVGLQAVAERCHGLRSLAVGGVESLTDAGLKAIADGCPGLRSLDVTYVKSLTDVGLKAIADGCPDLTDLRLKGHKHVTSAGLQAIADGCPGLVSLKLREIENLSLEDLQVIVKQCRCITSIELGGLKQLTDKWLGVLAEHCPGLTILNFQHSKGPTGGGLKLLAERCLRLTDLDLSGFKHLTGEELSALAQSCNSLTCLNLNMCKNVTDVGLRGLAEHCPALTYLCLYGCKGITPKGLSVIREANPSLSIAGPW